MTAICQICSEFVLGIEVPVPPIILDESAAAERQLQNFDLLAKAMMLHILSRHQAVDPSKSYAIEMMAISELAAKVYAMTFAGSSDKNFEHLREAWKAGVMGALFPSAYDATASGDSSAAADSSA